MKTKILMFLMMIVACLVIYREAYAKPVVEAMEKNYCQVIWQESPTFQKHGSGILINIDGKTYIMTAYHVVDRAWHVGSVARLDIIFHGAVINEDMEKCRAKIFRIDPEYDIALLIPDRVPNNRGAGISVQNFGDSDSLKSGDFVYKIGTPEFQTDIVGLGVVSKPCRFSDYNYPPIRALRIGLVAGGAGDSGCLLFDEQGCFMGMDIINHSYLVPVVVRQGDDYLTGAGKVLTDIYFFVSSNTLRERIMWMFNKRNQNGFLRFRGEDKPNGILLEEDVRETELMAGDIIFEIEGMKLNNISMLRDIISSFDKGDMVHIKVYRKVNGVLSPMSIEVIIRG